MLYRHTSFSFCSSFFLGALLLAASAAGAASAPLTPQSSAPPANLLLVTLDTWRWDYLGASGSGKVATPNLDALAAEGVLFLNTRSAAPVTLVAHASLFTGTHPTHHGVHSNGSFVLGDEQLTLAEVLRDHGYQTAAITAAYVVHSGYGLAQGFDSYADVLPQSLYNGNDLTPFYPELTADQVTDRGIAQVQRFLPGQPWFLWLHYFDPHAEYRAPQSFARSYPQDPYAAEVAFVDAQVGRMVQHLKARGQWHNTAVVLTADHGESLGEHGEETHGHFVYDATVKVASVLKLPGAPRGQRFDQRVGAVDLMPTALDALGIRVPASVQGESLRRLWDGSPRRRAGYSETFLPYYEYGWAYLRSLELDGWKYILAPEPELYDLRQDPHERTNLAARERERAASMRATLLRMIEQGAGQEAAVRQPAAEESSALASLGYLGSGVPAPSQTSEELQRLPDPKRRIHLERDIARAWGEQSRGNLAGASKLLEGVLKEDPQNVAVLRFAAATHRELGRWDRSLALLKQLGRHWPAEAWRAPYAQAHHHWQGGKPDAATPLYRQLLEDCRQDAASPAEKCVNALSDLVHLHLEAKRTAEARAALERYSLDHLSGVAVADRLRQANLWAKAALPSRAEAALLRIRDAAPAAPDVYLALGNLYRDTGRDGEAIAALQQALRLDPSFLYAKNNLATLYGSRGDLETSSRYLQEVLAADPNNSRALGNLAVNRLHQGQAEEAIRLFERAIRADPAAITARLNLAQLYLQRQEVSRALDLYRQVVELEPGNSVAQQVLRRFESQG